MATEDLGMFTTAPRPRDATPNDLAAIDEMLARLSQIPPTVREIGHNAPALLDRLKRQGSKQVLNPPPMSELFGILMIEDPDIPAGFVEFRWTDGRRERKWVGY